MSEALYRRAISVHGALAQIDMAIEEMAELIQALQHMKRGRVSLDEVCAEIADVTIMAEQMRFLLGPDEVDAFKAEKLARLASRLDATEAAR